jgi:hypothetical protein
VQSPIKVFLRKRCFPMQKGHRRALALTLHTMHTGKEDVFVGSRRLTMCRPLYCATAVAVVCFVGATSQASQEKPDGTGLGSPSAVSNWQMSNELTAFFDSARPLKSTRVDLSTPIKADIPVNSLVNSLAPSVHRITVEIEPMHTPSGGYPLVPLPPPLWSGSVGLGGLAVVGSWRKLRKSLR